MVVHQKSIPDYLLGSIPFAAAMVISVMNAAPSLAAPQLEEIIVTAALQSDDGKRSAVTILDRAFIKHRSAQHIEDLLSAAPNVNVASGASRGRFFQIRGIGERSQFVEPVNASVALLLDGIDLTGIGGVATTWDLQQVEVLRGPQGTLFGANALAGLISLQSTPPDSTQDRHVEAGVESYAGRRFGLAIGGELTPHWSGRLAVQQYQSDGFFDNQWLNTSNTNERDELTGRASLRYRNDQQQIDVALYRFEIDNGYDAFSLDNTRNTLSDQPGRDRALTDAARLRWEWSGKVRYTLQVSHAQSNTEYSYDEDWSYVGIAPGWEYSAVDDYRRDRTMTSLEGRVEGDTAKGSWVAGTYWRDEQEALRRDYTYLESAFESDLGIETAALFGQFSIDFAPALSAYVGARWEYRGSEYEDSSQVNERFSDTLWSGRAGLEWAANARNDLYVSVSRGVRGGGVNANLLASINAFPEELGTDFTPLGFFDAESLINAEVGWGWQNAEGSLSSKVTLFSMRRSDQQAKSSLVIPRPDGSTAFIDYTNNAARGSSNGLEWQFAWAATDALAIEASLGLLDAHFDSYVTADGDDLAGREQPHAPKTMSQLGLHWRPFTSWQAGLDVTTMSDFYFSDRHDTKSPSRTLFNGFIAWQGEVWGLRLWGRNLTDENTFARGFGSFGNDPRKEYAVEPYYQYGEPRIVGLTATYPL